MTPILAILSRPDAFFLFFLFVLFPLVSLGFPRLSGQCHEWLPLAPHSCQNVNPVPQLLASPDPPCCTLRMWAAALPSSLHAIMNDARYSHRTPLLSLPFYHRSFHLVTTSRSNSNSNLAALAYPQTMEFHTTTVHHSHLPLSPLLSPVSRRHKSLPVSVLGGDTIPPTVPPTPSIHESSEYQAEPSDCGGQ